LVSAAGAALDPVQAGYPNYSTDPPYYPSYTTIPTDVILASPVANLPMGAYVWTGDASDNDWANVNNWSSFTLPTAADNTVIPPSRTYYPETNTAGTPLGVTNNLDIQTGAHVYLPAGKQLTVNGTLNITSAQGLQVRATGAGVGSLITYGNVTYGASGSATVQAYIINDSVVTTFHPHLIGPMVSDPGFETATGNQGVYLSSFNLAAYSSYAYKYVEASNNWLNVYNNNTQVLSGSGILFSTTDATDHTLSMAGKLVTGTYITPFNLQHGTNNLDLLSNPFASALDFDDFKTANAAINNKYYIFNAQTNNYDFYIMTGSGTLPRYIQVGQGFFVETLNASPITFNNSMRDHSTAPFLKDMYATQLRLDMEGNGFKDALSSILRTLARLDMISSMTLINGGVCTLKPRRSGQLTPISRFSA